MPQNVFEREVASVDLSNGDAEIEIPRSHYLQRLAILLEWDITVDSTSAAKNRAGVLEAIQSMSFTLNGNQTIKKYDLEMGHFIDQYQYGTRPPFDAVDFSTASQQTGVVQHFMDFLITPNDLSAMLPAFETSDLTLELEAGDAADIEDGGDHITINALDVTVTSEERLRKSVAKSREKEEEVLDKLMVFKERQKRQSIDATGETTVKLPRGNTYYATPYRIYDNDSPNDALVESFEIEEDGVETHKSVGYTQARNRDAVEYGFDRSDLPTGFVYPNFGLHGDLSDVVATAGMDSWELSVDTDGTSPTDPAEVELVTQELIR